VKGSTPPWSRLAASVPLSRLTAQARRGAFAPPPNANDRLVGLDSILPFTDEEWKPS
jgi:hypothetical protein